MTPPVRIIFLPFFFSQYLFLKIIQKYDIFHSLWMMHSLSEATKVKMNRSENKALDTRRKEPPMMSDSRTRGTIKLWSPATYRIEIQGNLCENWADRLGNMRISSNKRADQSIVTTLTGRLQDQAELLGVLNSLYELHLPILMVEYLEMNNGV
ncbi:MAG: hypothetical protein WBM71_01065 [Sedimenticolaceae bacterium]